MKNRLLTYMMALVVSFVVASCSKGEDPFLQAGPARIEIAANATSATFAISSNVQWTISSSDTWATVSPTSGQGNATVNITSQTQTTHSSRSMTFTIKSKDVPEGGATVTLTQKEAPNELPTAPVLVSPANGETIAGLVPTFTWQASQDANGDAIAYTLKISKDQQTWSSFNTRELTYTMTTKQEMGVTYYWKVEATDGMSTDVISSEVFSYTTPSVTYHGEGEYKAYEINTETNPINIVLMGDGFIQEDLVEGAAYDQAMEAAVEAFFDIEPYRSYRDKFNIYFVYSESQHRGAMYGHGHDGSQSANFASFRPSTSFSATFDAASSNSTATTCDYYKVMNYARKVPALAVGEDVRVEGGYIYGALADEANPINHSILILVINDKRYAGTCSMWSDGACVGMCPMSRAFEPTLRHEVGGHGFPKLGDEYTYTGAPSQQEISNMKEWQNRGFYKNISVTPEPSLVPWSMFIGDSKYPEVGVYEGAMTFPTGVWRSEQISCMVDNRSYFNGISRYAIVERIMKISTGNATNSSYKYSYDEFKAQDKKDPNVANGLTKGGEKLPPLAPPVLFDVKVK